MSNRLVLTLVAGFTLGLGVSSLQGCTVPNPEHCVNNGGDPYCAQQHPDWENAYCSDNTCVDEITPDGCQQEIPIGCWFCEGKEKTSDDEPECSGMATGDGDGDMTTGDGDGDGDGDVTTGDGDGDGDGDTSCMGPEDCTGPDAPFCDDLSGMCVACDGTVDPDASCAGLDPALPVCEAGACVACAEGKTDACVDTTPICDTDTNTCVGCTSHDQCADTACNFDAGNCFDPANIIHVAGDDDNCDNGGDGSEATPYCDILSALTNAPAEPLIILHELFEDATYQEDTVVMNTVALFAADGEQPRLQGVNNNPAITVGASGIFFMRGVQISGTAMAEGFSVSGGAAWIDGSYIVNNGGGIVVDNGGSLVLVNSFAGGLSSGPALAVPDGTVDVAYTSLGLAPPLATPALQCSANAAGTVRNSIILTSNGTELDCGELTIENSALSMSMGDNTALGALDIGWFADYLNGDLHLSGTHPVELETAAQWLPGDPTDDIDGDPRPTEEGPDFAGADRIP